MARFWLGILFLLPLELESIKLWVIYCFSRWGNREGIKIMKNKILLGVFSAFIFVATLPLIAAFEAHVINVTAQINDTVECITVSDPVDFGTVFPQEQLDKTFDVALSQSFLNNPEHDLLEYKIHQEPKCWNGDENDPVFGEAVISGNSFICEDQGFEFLPILCPYLSKHEITFDPDNPDENDSPGIAAFHGPIDADLWTPLIASTTEVAGELQNSIDDELDTWNLDLKVPCFFGQCAQDWENFVLGINPSAEPDDYVQPAENEHLLFGCNIRVTVTGKPSTVGCKGKIDLMLVLDRSGSINSTELADLKNAANSFITALAPAADGVHVGQSSFATNATLDLHLTDNEASAHAAVNALLAGGFTNLKGGIDLAKTELDNPGDGHDRDDTESPDVMVIITDGAPNRPLPSTTADDVAAASADAARAAGIEIFVLGVGVSASTETYLKTEIADDAAHYFSVADFAALEAALLEIASCPE